MNSPSPISGANETSSTHLKLAVHQREGSIHKSQPSTCNLRRRTAPPGASQYRFSFDPPPPLEKCTTGSFALPRLQTEQRFTLLGKGTESLATNARSSEDGYRERGRRILVEENWGHSPIFLFFFFFFFLYLFNFHLFSLSSFFSHFWRIAGGRLQLDGAGFTHPQKR